MADNTNTLDCRVVLCNLFGLDPATATDEDITTAAAKASTAITAPDAANDGSEDDAANPAAGAGSAQTDPAVASLTAQVAALTATVEGFLGTSANRERSEIVALAAQQGREIPAAWLPDAKGKGGLPIDQLRTLTATLPVTVPTERRTAANADLKALSANGALNTADAEVQKKMGISKETWAKHNA